jgi:DNA processing protein
MQHERPARLAQIALMWHGALGPMAYRRLLGHFGDPQAVLRATAAELSLPSLGLDKPQVAALLQVPNKLEAVAKELRELAGQNIHVWCDVDEPYPRLLRRMRDRPPVLCIAGRMWEADEQAVAIVGTRTPTKSGERMAARLAQACVEAKLTVVSGLALGCDTWAHQGALQAQGRTIAILGSGIQLITPRENAELARRIAEVGAVLSEKPPRMEPSSSSLLMRNRLQVALSQAVIIVQAGESGGAMSTAERATKQGRPVYAVVWERGLPQAAGNEKLLRSGARPLSDDDEIEEVAQVVRENLERSLQAPADGEPQRGLFEEESGGGGESPN